jgi:serine/threonine protein kinase
MLPNYVASLNRYTEKDCRQLCRQIAEIIKLSHGSGMAHRNLHLNNFFVDRAVSYYPLPIFGSIYVVLANQTFSMLCTLYWTLHRAI